ncbi:MAG: tetratricopeptide repeat protein [Pseudomonadota bacterium]
MSTINEALKKAQKEKDTRDRAYGISIASGEKETRFFHARVLWFGALSLIVIFLAFTYFSWLDLKVVDTLADSEGKKVEPVAAPQPESDTDIAASYDRAKHLHKNGDLEEARRFYQETLKEDPGYVDALNNLGVIYLHDEEYLAAKLNFEKAIRLKPEYAEPYYNMACFYAIKGEPEKSLMYLKKAATLDHSVREWAGRDADLKNLRGLPEFEGMIQKSE